MSDRNTPWEQEAVLGNEAIAMAVCKLTLTGDDIFPAHHTMSDVFWTLEKGEGLVLLCQKDYGWIAIRMIPGSEFVAQSLQPFMFLPRPAMTFEINCLPDQVDGSDLEYSDQFPEEILVQVEGTVERVRNGKILLRRGGASAFVTPEEDITEVEVGEVDAFELRMSFDAFIAKLSTGQRGESLYRLIRILERPSDPPTPRSFIEEGFSLEDFEPSEFIKPKDNILRPGEVSALCPRASRYKRDRR